MHGSPAGVASRSAGIDQHIIPMPRRPVIRHLETIAVIFTMVLFHTHDVHQECTNILQRVQRGGGGVKTEDRVVVGNGALVGLPRGRGLGNADQFNG